VLPAYQQGLNGDCNWRRSDLGRESRAVWKTSEGGIRKSPFVMLFSFTTFLLLFSPPPPNAP